MEVEWKLILETTLNERKRSYWRYTPFSTKNHDYHDYGRKGRFKKRVGLFLAQALDQSTPEIHPEARNQTASKGEAS